MSVVVAKTVLSDVQRCFTDALVRADTPEHDALALKLPWLEVDCTVPMLLMVPVAKRSMWVTVLM